jgi:two-component system alkaline phosphatase synthesis response regulator PhoP
MAKEKILVIEDDEDILELITYNLVKNGYQVSATGYGEEAIRLIQNDQPNLILLDIMLLDMNGIEVCSRLKQDKKTNDIPIIFASAKGEEEDICKGLMLGADDYVVKPFSVKVLLARIESVLRRKRQIAPSETDVIKTENIEINPNTFEVFVKGNKLELTLTEFKILHTLVRKVGRVFTRYQLVDIVHGKNHIVTDRSIDFQIVGLRKKLGAIGELIETVRGVGYRFRENE